MHNMAFQSEIFDCATASVPIVAGPCSAESRSQVLDSAAGLSGAGIRLMRAGLWKPRTRPGGFEGVGERGLEWLKEASGRYGMRVGTEVACAAHVRACLDAGLDFIWIGARSSSNPFLIEEIAEAVGDSPVAVLVKNPLAPDIELWAGAVERLRRSGVKNVAAVLRGCTPLVHGKCRNDPQWGMGMEMKRRFPGVPVLADPSHMAGDAALVPSLALRAVNLGLDGLMIEAHPCPSEALSDAGQQLDMAALRSLAASLPERRGASADTSMTTLRGRIDACDESLLRVLSERMSLCREIGRLKKASGMPVLQASRWDDVLASAIRSGSEMGLPPEFVRTVFTDIHECSVSQQLEILEDES